MDANDSTHAALSQLVGIWDTRATHPAMPGVVVDGTVHTEWLEGERFLIHRARSDHADFPDSISILGLMDRGRAEETADGPLQMHYFDSRGVARVYEAEVDAREWRLSRTDPGFSQRFRGVFSENGRVLRGQWEASEDDATWRADLAITYTRRDTP